MGAAPPSDERDTAADAAAAAATAMCLAALLGAHLLGGTVFRVGAIVVTAEYFPPASSARSGMPDTLQKNSPVRQQYQE